MTPDGIVGVRSVLEGVESMAQALGLPATEMLARRMLDRYSEDDPPTIDTLARESIELRGRFADELNAQMFLALDPQMVRYYQQFHSGWEAALERFPSIEFDVEEAAKCLAFERATACVFHLMRTLEIGLYALAEDLAIENLQVNWQNAIDQIEKAIRELDRQHPKRDFYAEAATHFIHVKDAWRNNAAHSGQVYPVDRAERIYENVRSFMDHLATQRREG